MIGRSNDLPVVLSRTVTELFVAGLTVLAVGVAMLRSSRFDQANLPSAGKGQSEDRADRARVQSSSGNDSLSFNRCRRRAAGRGFPPGREPPSLHRSAATSSIP